MLLNLFDGESDGKETTKRTTSKKFEEDCK